ncbi:DinB family protein [Bacillus sp. CGMCC 1.16607]|uniref:DinB family protein n=1 Tax=Bacillus sp. CGMCC 1.16607 TaxID=3351842 RepID=UPI00362CDCFB
MENMNLIETRNRLIDEIFTLSNDEFNRNPDLYTWSIAQVCHHLLLVEKAFTYAIEMGLKKGQKAEQKNLNAIADRTMKLKAPEIVIPDTKLFEVQQMIDLLNDSRNSFMAVLHSIEDESILTERSAKHPLFDDLPLNQWVELLYLHEDRHIEQIKEIKIEK